MSSKSESKERYQRPDGFTSSTLILPIDIKHGLRVLSFVTGRTQSDLVAEAIREKLAEAYKTPSTRDMFRLLAGKVAA